MEIAVQVFPVIHLLIMGLYDLNLMDDQLVLGIKGTLSVVELKILQLRLVAGTEEKARRGALVRLPRPS